MLDRVLLICENTGAGPAKVNTGTLAIADGWGMLNILLVTLLDTLLVDIPVPRIVSAAGTDGAGGPEVPPLAGAGVVMG